MDKETVDLTVLLTVYKRKNLRRQLDAILSQSVRPQQIIVFQNGHFQRLPRRVITRSGVDYVVNSTNTGFFGRFAHLLNAQTEYVAVLDDDIVPGERCLENYLRQAKELNAIIGGNGRIGLSNPERPNLFQPRDIGLREAPVLVDFVGHMWVFEKKLLHDMFAIKPLTYSTGEDMHLCFSAKLLSNRPSYCAAQRSRKESCDVAMNRLGKDNIASFRQTPQEDRAKVEHYFVSQGVKLITPTDQRNATAGNYFEISK